MSVLSSLSNMFSKPRRIVPLVVVAVIGAAAASWALTSRSGTSAPAVTEAVARPVQVQVVSIAPLVQPRILVGTLRARIEGDQGFRVAGKIATRQAQIGDRVKAGTVIATLDETDYRLNREAAEAELSAARAAARQAELERDRIGELRAKGWSTEQLFDRQKATLEEALGRLKRAERQVELTTNAQSYAELKAEADGIVIAVFAEAGQVVAAGQPIVRIARDGDREAQVSLPEQDLALAKAPGASVALWSDPTVSHVARLRELSPNADPATRTFQARYIVSGLAPDAPLGMTVTLTLTGGEARKAAKVPLSAILNEGGDSAVYLVEKESGAIIRKPVTVLSYDNREAVVGAGLAEGDRVITLGLHTLRVGQKVRVLGEAKQG